MQMWLCGVVLLVAAVNGVGVRHTLEASEYSHVVVIPDVHGDKDALVRSLWLAWHKVGGFAIEFSGLYWLLFRGSNGMGLPEKPLWDGPSVALIQLGDLVDRGPYSLDCLGMMGVVERVLGWHVVQLMGNHELLGVLGQSDEYVHVRDAATFGGIAGRHAQFQHGGKTYTHLIENFQSLAVLNGPDSVKTLFVHGGIHLPWLTGALTHDNSVSGINAAMTELLSDEHVDRKKVANDVHSPLWTRVLAEGDVGEVCGSLLTSVLEFFDVSRIIVGHTPQEDFTAKTRCSGRIILADVMMSRWMVAEDVDETSSVGGRPVAIVLSLNATTHELDAITAHYTDLKTGSVAESVDLMRAHLEKPMRTVVEMASPMIAVRIGDVPLRRPVPRRHTDRLFETLIFQDELATIYASNGFATLVLHAGQVEHDVFLIMQRLSQVPVMQARGIVVTKDKDALAPYGDRLACMSFRTECDVMLGSYMAVSVTVLTDSAKAQIREVVESLHAAGLILGVKHYRQIYVSFAVNHDRSQVELLNWSRLKRGSEEEMDAELALLAKAEQYM